MTGIPSRLCRGGILLGGISLLASVPGAFEQLAIPDHCFFEECVSDLDMRFVE